MGGLYPNPARTLFEAELHEPFLSGMASALDACLDQLAAEHIPIGSELRHPTAAHVMTISRNGQVSIPAEARSRWKTRRVVVVDLGDRVVMRPLVEDPVGDLEGKYRGRGPDTERARQQARIADATHERDR